jgi:hypothetical protein
VVTSFSESKAATDGPNEFLNQVNIISYTPYIENNQNSGKCRIDWEAFKVALQFVANQSTRLKIITNIEQMETATAKYDATAYLIKDFTAWRAAKQEADKYTRCPAVC